MASGGWSTPMATSWPQPQPRSRSSRSRLISISLGRPRAPTPATSASSLSDGVLGLVAPDRSTVGNRNGRRVDDRRLSVAVGRSAHGTDAGDPTSSQDDPRQPLIRGRDPQHGGVDRVCGTVGQPMLSQGPQGQRPDVCSFWFPCWWSGPPDRIHPRCGSGRSRRGTLVRGVGETRRETWQQPV